MREALELSQNEMLKRLGSPEDILGINISGYERGVLEPPLISLLAYGRTVGVSVETLIDNQMDLPAKVSSKKQLQCRPTAAALRTKK